MDVVLQEMRTVSHMNARTLELVQRLVGLQVWTECLSIVGKLTDGMADD